jgi:hypothetical protein
VGSDSKYPDEYELAELTGFDRRTFHRVIKPQIVRDHWDLLTDHGIQNPDIGLDNSNCIVLRDPRDFSNLVETKTPLNLYRDAGE